MIDREMEIAELLARARPRRADPRGGRGQRGGAAPRRADAVADQPAARHPAARCSTRSRTASRITTTPSCASCRASTPSSRTELAALTRRWRRCRAAIVPAHGQLDRRRPRRQPVRHARRCCARRCGCRAAGRCGFYLDELHSSAPSCRSTAGWSASRDELTALAARSPDRLAAPRATSPTGARSPASTRAWRRRRARSTSCEPPRQAVGERAALRRQRRSSSPIST